MAIKKIKDLTDRELLETIFIEVKNIHIHLNLIEIVEQYENRIRTIQEQFKRVGFRGSQKIEND